MHVTVDLVNITKNLTCRRYFDRSGNIQIELFTDLYDQSIILYLKPEDVKILKETLDRDPTT